MCLNIFRVVMQSILAVVAPSQSNLMNLAQCNTVNYSYTGIRTYRTENFSPAQKQLTVCFAQSGSRIYRISYIPDSKS